MTSPASEDLYDPDRPWVSNEDDDPSRANWFQLMFIPTGTVGKLSFLRGQLMLWIVRALALIVGFGMGFSGSPGIGGAIIAGVFALAAYASTTLHVRRLADAGRSLYWALIVSIPILLAALFGLLATSMAANQAEKARIEAAKTPEQRAAEKQAAERLAAETADADSSTEGASEAPSNRSDRGGRRGGRGGQGSEGPPPLPLPVLGGLWIYFLSGLGVAIFSLRFVARAERRTQDAFVR